MSRLAIKKTSEFLKPFQYMALIFVHTFSKFQLKRVPEPSALTDQAQHVSDYNKAINTVMVLPYVLVLDFIHHVINKGNSQSESIKAVDLCCGPGHFTRMIAKNLNCSEVIGVDLSEPMLAVAEANAKKENLSDKLNYLKSDVSKLDAIASNSVDIVTFMDGAHHMNSVQEVTSILKEADRIAKPDGVIVLIDPVRPKSNRIAKLYLKISGKNYLQLGLVHFYKDFYDSLLASWSPEEMFKAIPTDTNRKWIQLIPFGFPSFQILIAIPEGREDIFVNKGLDSKAIKNLIPKDAKGDWIMLKLSFLLAKQKILNVSK